MPRHKVEDGAPEATPREVVVPHSPLNEQVVLGAAAVDDEVRVRLTRKLTADRFHVAEHRAIWEGFAELSRRKLAYDPATLKGLAPGADLRLLAVIEDARPDVPENLDHHVETLLWDHARISAAEGPISALIEALRDAKTDPAKVRALARSIGESFNGANRSHLLDSDALLADASRDMHTRTEQTAIYPLGIPDLDYFEEVEEGVPRLPRMLPGAMPGLMTMLTGISGSGKSTLAGHITLGLARQKRRVLYCAWEPKARMTLQLLGCLSAGLSRARMMAGLLTPHEKELIEERMGRISRWVRFMSNPFKRRKGQKASNDYNLDLVEDHVGESGCEVVVFDLWKRCLCQSRPDDEEQAVERQQAMLEDLNVHGILLHQQRLKDIEMRPDKRPTREGQKGSAIYTEAPDTIIAPHRPALFKKMDDDTMEIFVLKQRWGQWPLGTAFDWDAETGQIARGRSIPYDAPGQTSSFDEFIAPPKQGTRRRRN